MTRSEKLDNPSLRPGSGQTSSLDTMPSEVRQTSPGRPSRASQVDQDTSVELSGEPHPFRTLPHEHASQTAVSVAPIPPIRSFATSGHQSYPPTSIHSGIRDPIFVPNNVNPIVISHTKLRETLMEILVPYLKSRQYDRICYLEKLYDHCQKSPKESLHLPAVRQSLDTFQACSGELTRRHKGGNCVGLAADIKNMLPPVIRSASFLSGGRIKAKLSTEGGPYFDHGALLISYQDPEDNKETGFALLDPSFDFPNVPIVSTKRSDSFLYSMGKIQDEWVFSLNQDQSCIICQPKPLGVEPNWKPNDIFLKKRTLQRLAIE